MDYMGHEYDLFLMQNEKVSKLIKLLSQKPDSLSHLARNLEMHYSTVQKYLIILLEREIIQKAKNSDRVLYEINSDMIIKLKKIINGAVFIEFA